MPESIRVPPSAPARLVVLASGTGSLLQSVLDAAVGDYPARVVAVGVDRDCPAEQIAAAADIPSYRVALGDYPDRSAWDDAIAEATGRHAPDLIVSAGFMKILGPAFLARFPRAFAPSLNPPSAPRRHFPRLSSAARCGR